MDIGDLIMWALLMAGAYAITRNTWHLVKPRVLSSWRSIRALLATVRLPDTSQVKPLQNYPVPARSEPVRNRDTDIVYLATRVDDRGEWLYSANKIAEFVGGARAETLAAIRAARGQPAPPPDPATLLRVRDERGERLIAR